MLEWVVFYLKDNISVTFSFVNISSKVCASIHLFYLTTFSYISTSTQHPFLFYFFPILV